MNHMPDNGTGLPRSGFSTVTVRANKQFTECDVRESWIEAMSVFFEPDELSDPVLKARFNPTNTIQGHIESFLHPGFMTIKVEASGQTFRRSKHHISGDGVDGILLQCLKSGSVNTQQKGKHLPTKKGGILIADMTQPLEAHTSHVDTYSLLLPRRSVERLGIDPDSLHLNHHPSTSALAAILNQHISELHQRASGMTQREAALLHDPTVALIKAVIEPTTDHLQEASPIIQRNQLLEIRRFVDKNLTNPSLDNDMISDWFGLSRATLYRLTKPLGGIQRFIRNRRLKYAFQILTTEPRNPTTLTNIAFDLGFGSENTFRRAFKEAFSMSPKEARELGMNAHREYQKSIQGGTPEDVRQIPTGDLLYKKWIRDLFS